MVTIEEAKRQLTQQSRVISQRQKQIRETSIRKLSQKELRSQTQQGQAQRRLQNIQLQEAKQEALQRLQPAQVQVQEAKVKIIGIEKDIKRRQAAAEAASSSLERDFRIVNKFIAEGKSPVSLTRSQKKLFREATEGVTLAQKRQELSLLQAGLFDEANILAQTPGVLFEEQSLKEALDPLFIPQSSEILFQSRVPQIDTQAIPQRLPSTVELPTATERFQGIFQRRGLRDPITGGAQVLEDVTRAFEVPEVALKEAPVRFIDQPSLLSGTRIRRAVDFSDINTGRLPPKQNFELSVQEITSNFNRGLISEQAALQQLKSAEKRFIDRETIRRLPATVLGGLAFGAAAAIAAPISVTLGGAALATSFRKRKELLAFSKRNPKAAIIQFTASIAGAVLGGAGVKALKAPKLGVPVITLIGKGRQKTIDRLAAIDEPQFKLLVRNRRITGTRLYSIEIPTTKGKTNLKIMEFQKDGVKRFIGLEEAKGKITGALRGRTITTTGQDGLTSMITRVIQLRNRGKLTDVQISTFVERARIKATDVKATRVNVLTVNEAKLARQFNLKGLTASEVRGVLRRKLFGDAESLRRRGNAFSQAEFDAASKLSKSEFSTQVELDAFRLGIQRAERPGGVMALRLLDIRTTELGLGRTVQDAGILPSVRIRARLTPEGTTPVSRIPKPIQVGGRAVRVEGFDPLGFKTRITQVPIPRRTTLQSTFSQVALDTPQVPASPTGTFLQIAQQIQRGQKITAAKTQAIITSIRGLVSGARPTQQVSAPAQRTSLVGIQRAVGGEGLTQQQLDAGRGRVFDIQFQPLVAPPISVTAQQQRLASTLLVSETQQQPIISRNIFGQVTTPIISQKEQLKLLQNFIQQQKQQLRFRQKQLTQLGQTAKTTLKTRPRTIPPPTAIPILPETSARTQMREQAQEMMDIFETFVKKKGKDVSIGEFGTRREAREALFTRLKTTLRASGFVKREGKKISLDLFGSEFRPSKTDPLRVVQRKTRRLGTAGETQQIQFFRSQRGGFNLL